MTLLFFLLQYPGEIRDLEYDPKFAVRGLHYDIEQGLLMKLDQFQQIQMSSIYRGLTPLSQEDVAATYGSRALPLSYVEGHLKGVSHRTKRSPSGSSFQVKSVIFHSFLLQLRARDVSSSILLLQLLFVLSISLLLTLTEIYFILSNTIIGIPYNELLIFKCR